MDTKSDHLVVQLLTAERANRTKDDNEHRWRPGTGNIPLLKSDTILRWLINNKRTWMWGGQRHMTEATLSSLGCIAYEAKKRQRFSSTKDAKNENRDPSVSPDGRKTVYLPPNEYCSISIFNQVRNGEYVSAETISDRGGTIKSVLQSSKSFIHVLTTHPLKNTFRGYIQIRPHLNPTEIGLPRHHAVQIFSLDVERDRDKCIWGPNLCATCVSNGSSVRCSKCPFWPDESFEFAFETNANFGLFLKRDPCIHNGSVVLITRVYVTFATHRDTHLESVYVSSFSLKNLNADFDGDTVTVMIVRGIESNIELRATMSEPLLYGCTPRFTFCQSFVYRIFHKLCFDQGEFAKVAQTAPIDQPRAMKNLLLQRLNIWGDNGARARAQRLLGPWYSVYGRAFAPIFRKHRRLRKRQSNNDEDDDWWQSAIWNVAILDRAYVLHVRQCKSHNVNEGDMHEWFIRHVIWPDRDKAELRVPLLTERPLSLQNWLIVHSGAKSNPLDLWNLHEKFYGAVNRSPQHDMLVECEEQRANSYRRYLDDFVLVSKNVPKSSYFASGLKWVMQKCKVRNGHLWMDDVCILPDVSYFLQDIALDLL